MNELHSVSGLLARLEHDTNEAARQLWDRFIGRLIHEGHRRLGNLPRRAVDEEDVALAAFHSFVRGAAAGRFQKLQNREDLWQVLVMLVERKAIEVQRRELADKRGGGHVRGESVFEKMIGESSAGMGIHQVSDPNPVAIDWFTHEVREMLDGLGDEQLKQIAIKRLEGYTNAEIAQQLGIAVRSVERKLQLIRQQWENGFGI